MTPAHRRYLWCNQAIPAVAVNLVMNAVIARGVFRDLDPVPLWGEQSIAGDTGATCFFLPFLTALVVTPLARREVRLGRLSRLTSGNAGASRLPASVLGRSLAIGLASVFLVAPLAVLTLASVGPRELPLREFVLFKALFGAVLAAPVAPLVAYLALFDPSPEDRGRTEPP